jgi:hypothetical protein
MRNAKASTLPTVSQLLRRADAAAWPQPNHAEAKNPSTSAVIPASRRDRRATLPTYGLGLRLSAVGRVGTPWAVSADRIMTSDAEIGPRNTATDDAPLRRS